jgi:PPOX class probable F420-dependent enzyme
MNVRFTPKREERTMPKRRDAIRMTDEEMWAFVEERKSLQVATLNKDGSPQLTTLWFAIVDGAFVFETFTKSQKIRNLKRDPRIAILAEDGTEYENLRGVSINGTAELVEEESEVERYAFAVTKRNHPGLSDDDARQAAKALSKKRTAVVIRPAKIASWDHRKLGGGY